MDVVDELLQDALSVAFGDEVHLQRYGLCTLAACGILVGGGIVELFDEGRLDTVGTRLAKQMVPPIVVGRGDKRHGGVLGETCTARAVVIPVAQSLTEDVA